MLILRDVGKFLIHILITQFNILVESKQECGNTYTSPKGMRGMCVTRYQGD